MLTVYWKLCRVCSMFGLVILPAVLKRPFVVLRPVPVEVETLATFANSSSKGRMTEHSTAVLNWNVSGLRLICTTGIKRTLLFYFQTKYFIMNFKYLMVYLFETGSAFPRSRVYFFEAVSVFRQPGELLVFNFFEVLLVWLIGLVKSEKKASIKHHLEHKLSPN